MNNISGVNWTQMKTPEEMKLEDMENFIKRFVHSVDILATIPKSAVKLEQVAGIINELAEEARELLKK